MNLTFKDSDDDLCRTLAAEIFYFADQVFDLPGSPCKKKCLFWITCRGAQDFYGEEDRSCLNAKKFAAPQIKRFAEPLLAHHYDPNTYQGIMGEAAVFNALPAVIQACMMYKGSSEEEEVGK